MRAIKDLFLFFFLLITGISSAQLGLGTVSPNVSSVLDIVSPDKGILTPRMTLVERDSIQNPAIGLLIYNKSNSNFNYYNAGWKDFFSEYATVTAIDTVATQSNLDALVPAMKLIPKKGKYVAKFSCQYINYSAVVPVSNPINTVQCLADLNSVYNVLHRLPRTSEHSNNFNFGGTFSTPEVITPGKYALNGALAISGYLTLDAGGDANAVFIFEGNGAINIAAGSEIKLIGGTQSCNVFWVGEGNINVGANSVVAGILISHGFAVAVGANASIDGRMFTTAGAIAFGPGIATRPTALSTSYNLGSLSTFVVFTGIGAINNTGTPLTSIYNGDLASNSGATGSLSGATVNGTIYPSGETNTTIPFVVSSANFSIYQNGIIIPESTRSITSKVFSSNVTLQSLVDINEGEVVEIKWKTDSGTLFIGNRNFSLIKVNGL